MAFDPKNAVPVDPNRKKQQTQQGGFNPENVGQGVRIEGPELKSIFGYKQPYDSPNPAPTSDIVKRVIEEAIAPPMHFANQFTLNYPRSISHALGYEMPGEDPKTAIGEVVSRGAGLVGGVSGPAPIRALKVMAQSPKLLSRMGTGAAFSGIAAPESEPMVKALKDKGLTIEGLVEGLKQELGQRTGAAAIGAAAGPVLGKVMDIAGPPVGRLVSGAAQKAGRIPQDILEAAQNIWAAPGRKIDEGLEAVAGLPKGTVAEMKTLKPYEIEQRQNPEFQQVRIAGPAQQRVQPGVQNLDANTLRALGLDEQFAGRMEQMDAPRLSAAKFQGLGDVNETVKKMFEGRKGEIGKQYEEAMAEIQKSSNLTRFRSELRSLLADFVRRKNAGEFRGKVPAETKATMQPFMELFKNYRQGFVGPRDLRVLNAALGDLVEKNLGTQVGAKAQGLRVNLREDLAADTGSDKLKQAVSQYKLMKEFEDLMKEDFEKFLMKNLSQEQISQLQGLEKFVGKEFIEQSRDIIAAKNAEKFSKELTPEFVQDKIMQQVKRAANPGLAGHNEAVKMLNQLLGTEGANRAVREFKGVMIANKTNPNTIQPSLFSMARREARKLIRAPYQKPEPTPGAKNGFLRILKNNRGSVRIGSGEEPNVQWGGETDKVANQRLELSRLAKLPGGGNRIVYKNNAVVVKVAKSPLGLRANDLAGDNFIGDHLPALIERGKDYIVVEYVPRNDSETGKFLAPLQKFTAQDFKNKTPELQDALTEMGLDDFMNYDLLWNDFKAKRNWGWKDGKAFLLDEGALNHELRIGYKPDEFDNKAWREILDARRQRPVVDGQDLKKVVKND